MKIWTVSDLHVDFSENFQWIINLSEHDYQKDLLIVAGDITDERTLFVKALSSLRKKFHSVIFLPGNHDLWVKSHKHNTSFESFLDLQNILSDCGIFTKPIVVGTSWIVPLLGWYDYSFGAPSIELKNIWADFRRCKWPNNYNSKMITNYFTALNRQYLSIKAEKIISFSHFLPRIDLVPNFVPLSVKKLFPVMGTTLLEEQIRILRPCIHIYGHSHLNRDVNLNGIRYINNAFGYPYETRICAKNMLCIGEI